MTVVGSGGCWRGSSSGSSAVIVRGAWKTEKRAWRLEGDVVPAASYLSPMVRGRKEIAALRKELENVSLCWQASWKRWVRLGAACLL